MYQSTVLEKILERKERKEKYTCINDRPKEDSREREGKKRNIHVHVSIDLPRDL